MVDDALGGLLKLSMVDDALGGLLKIKEKISLLPR